MALPSSSAQQLRETLGARLRELRVEAGMSGRQLARLMVRHPSKVSRIELGRVTPTVADIEAWCAHCGVPDQEADLVASMRAIEGMFVEWRRIESTGLRRPQVELLPLYELTRRFRAYSSHVIPGLLQTRAYTGEVLHAIRQRRGMVIDDVDKAVALRMERQRVLREGNRRFAFLIEESALRNGIGGASVMAEQLDHLVTASTLPSVSLGVVPMQIDRPRWPAENFWIFDDEQVRVELVSCRLTITQPREIAMYAQVFNDLGEQAVFGSAARNLLQPR